MVLNGSQVIVEKKIFYALQKINNLNPIMFCICILILDDFSCRSLIGTDEGISFGF